MPQLSRSLSPLSSTLTHTGTGAFCRHFNWWKQPKESTWLVNNPAECWVLTTTMPRSILELWFAFPGQLRSASGPVASIFIHYHVTNESHWLRATHQGIWLVDSFLYGIHVTNAFSDGSQNEWWNCNGKYIHRYKDKCNDTSTIMFLAALFAIYCDRV